MKYVLIFDDSETDLNELQIKAPNAACLPLIKEIFVSKDGTPVYLTETHIQALNDIHINLAFEELKKRKKEE